MNKFKNYYYKTKEKLLPIGTKRRKIYDLIRKGISVIENEGLRIFFKKVYYYFNPFPNSKIKIEKLVIPILIDENVTINEKVSVIIPTKNAGNDFQFLLDKIKAQKKIKEIEIIIIDSGSEDNTLEIGKNYTNLILLIPPENFSHSKTRNMAAEKARGDYLFFLTQDAIPISESMIYDMIKILKSDPKISIVTCRQIPRSDAELMAIYNHYSYYKTMSIYNDLIVSSNNLNQLSSIQKRKISQTANNCILIDKKLFLNYRFFGDYAEDLDLSLRLLRDSYKICYLYSHAIIHSHNRGCLYYFKVNYKDRKSVIPVLEDKPFEWKLYDLNLFIKSIIIFYRICKFIINKYEFDELIKNIKVLFFENLNSNQLVFSIQDNVENFFYNINPEFFDINKNLKIENEIINILFDNYYNQLLNFKEFLSTYGAAEKNELKDTILKICMSVCGSMLGDYYCFLKEKNFISTKVIELDNIISRSI